MNELTEEEVEELARIQKNPRRVESARKAGLASGNIPNSGRFKPKGDKRSDAARKISGQIHRERMAT